MLITVTTEWTWCTEALGLHQRLGENFPTFGKCSNGETTMQRAPFSLVCNQCELVAFRYAFLHDLFSSADRLVSVPSIQSYLEADNISD